MKWYGSLSSLPFSVFAFLETGSGCVGSADSAAPPMVSPNFAAAGRFIVALPLGVSFFSAFPLLFPLFSFGGPLPFPLVLPFPLALGDAADVEAGAGGSPEGRKFQNAYVMNLV